VTLDHRPKRLGARAYPPSREVALRVLFVGPDGDDAARAARALRLGRHAATVLHAATAVDARADLAEGDVDAVLVDLRALAVLSDLRRTVARAARLPCIVLLDKDDVVDFKQAVSAGAAGFYYKQQLSPILLQRTLRQVVQEVPV
jgi:DNA-binding NarL/FixJ family response regulator